jgi:P-type Mg2+ transporter
MIETAFWKQPIAELLTGLSAKHDGLTSNEASLRLLRYGRNDAIDHKRTPGRLRLTQRLFNPLVIILLLASAISAAMGDLASFAIVACIVFLSVLLDFAQESRALRAIEALRDQVALMANVRRDGVEKILPVVELVPGDVARLTAGDLVPADGVLLSCRHLFVNQALLTGESFPVEKRTAEFGNPTSEINAADNVALAGTAVISGTGLLLVCQTGHHSMFGQLANTLIA